jgi:hypothetical protein
MMLPGRQRSGRKRKGPEPTISVMRCVFGTRARRSGIITGSGALGLPSTCSSSGKGSFSTSVKLRASVASIDAVAASSMRPSGSRGAQRRSDSTHSAAVTGAPSCHLRPSRRRKRQVRRSVEVSHASTICGLIWPRSSMANSVSKTCVAKVRVMAAVMTCGSRMTTSDSSTTSRALAARASGGRMMPEAASAAPPARMPRRPRGWLQHLRSLRAWWGGA